MAYWVTRTCALLQQNCAGKHSHGRACTPTPLITRSGDASTAVTVEAEQVEV